MSLTNGTRLGPYEILSPIGAGGMGEVYRARDTRLGRDVAVKVLPAEFASDPERLRRFEQEARAAAALNHPNILVLYDIGHHDGGPYIVTELLEGETLRQRLRGGALPPAKAVDFGVQIAQGLAAAHEKGILHRDIKPENLWLTKDGRIKILDFGLAQLRLAVEGAPAQSQAPTSDSPTREGKVLGTPGYMSPEQVRGKPVDARTDIFAFGIVLYEMLAGRRAFAGDTAADTQAAILTKDPDPLPPITPTSLDRVVRRCLEKRPKDRYLSVHELLLALEVASTSSAPPAPAPVAAGSEARGWSMRRLVMAGAVAVLFATALTAVLLWRPWRMKPSLPGVVAAVAPSLVVLPCKVLGSPESAYLTDAVPSTISTLLGEVKGMETKVPPTSFEVEKVQGDLDKIAKAYGVQMFVLSTATAEGDHLIFNIQVADARTRKVQWSHQYQGSRENYTTMAREAAQGICKELLPEAAPLGSAPGVSSNSEAELAFQQGKYYASRHFNHLAKADFDRALDAFHRAFQLDPKSAEAATRIASLYKTAVEQGYMPRVQAKAARDEWFQKAVALGPRSSEVWTLRADFESAKPDPDLKKLIDYSLKAAQLAPADPGAQGTLAVLGLLSDGSAMLCVEAMQERLRLDPLDMQGYSVLASTLTALGRTGEARIALDTQQALDPGNLWGLLTKVYVLVEAGQTMEASAVQKQLEAGGSYGPARDQFVTNGKWLLSLAAGDGQEARASVKAIMDRFADPKAVPGWLQWDIIWLLPSVNRRFGKDAALDLLVLSTKRGATMPYDALMLRPDLKELREDPRAKDVIAKTRAPFDLLIGILRDARSRGECPKYLEKPMDDLLRELKSKGAWP